MCRKRIIEDDINRKLDEITIILKDVKNRKQMEDKVIINLLEYFRD